MEACSPPVTGLACARQRSRRHRQPRSTQPVFMQSCGIHKINGENTTNTTQQFHLVRFTRSTNEQNNNRIKRAQHQYMYPYIFHYLSENSGSPVVNIPTMNKGYEDLKERHRIVHAL